MIYMKYFFFFISLSLASLGLCTEEESPYARFRKATQLAELAYKDRNLGLVTDVPHVTLEGINVISKMFHGDGGRAMEDYLSKEHSGFNGYILEHNDETIVAIRGTKDPLHLLLDLHIIFAGAGENPKEILDKLLQDVFNLGWASRTLVSAGLNSLAPASGTASKAAAPVAAPPKDEGQTLAGVFLSAVKEAALETAAEALPPEIRALYALIAERNIKALQKILHDRFVAAVEHAKRCIETAILHRREQKLRVVGHSLGGALATIAMEQLHTEGKLGTTDFEVNAICSPGSLKLLKLFETPVDESFSSRVFTLVRAGDLVSNFGEHIGNRVDLPPLSEPTLAILKEDSTPTPAGGLLSWVNPLAYLTAPANTLMRIHSSRGALLDVKALVEGAPTPAV